MVKFPFNFLAKCFSWHFSCQTHKIPFARKFPREWKLCSLHDENNTCIKTGSESRPKIELTITSVGVSRRQQSQRILKSDCNLSLTVTPKSTSKRDATLAIPAQHNVYNFTSAMLLTLHVNNHVFTLKHRPHIFGYF